MRFRGQVAYLKSFAVPGRHELVSLGHEEERRAGAAVHAADGLW